MINNFAREVVSLLENPTKAAVDRLHRQVEFDKAVDAIALGKKSKEVRMDLVDAMVDHCRATGVPEQGFDPIARQMTGITYANFECEGRKYDSYYLVACGTALNIGAGKHSTTVNSSIAYKGGLDNICRAIGFDSSAFAGRLLEIGQQYQKNVDNYMKNQSLETVA
jgi:hypothetical protein